MVATQKLPQVLQLNPSNEIVFYGPFDKVVTSYLHLKNPSSDRVCFKIKTTAPRRYCVRPNNGIIEPSDDIKIAIMLQPMDEDSQAERSKHKFMVLSTIISEEDSAATLDEIWSKAGSAGQMDSKLRCVFQTPDENGGQDSPINRQKSEADDPMGGSDRPLSNISSTVASTKGPTKDTSYQRQQTQSGKNRDEPTITTSTPIVTRATSSTSKDDDVVYTALALQNMWEREHKEFREQREQGKLREQKFADKSVASSHNLTSSFLQPMSDDYKIVLISLAMLFLGVILGKYII